MLDFDGVIADALMECAAVTWHAGRGGSAPPLPEAISAVPDWFVDRFRQVRAYSRTLDDFMVANALNDDVTPLNRGAFIALRASVPATELAAQAELAEQVRGIWREHQPDLWLGLHQVHPQMVALMNGTEHSIIVLSAKDAESIGAILDHHGLKSRITHIEGSCREKRAVLQRLLAEPEGSDGLIFIDDSIDNVVCVADLPLMALWAEWGYQGIEDKGVAKQHGIAMIRLDALTSVELTGCSG